MSKDSINEMERIQKGLESFLEQEVKGYDKVNASSERKTGNREPAPINIQRKEIDFILGDPTAGGIQTPPRKPADGSRNREIQASKPVKGNKTTENIYKEEDKKKKHKKSKSRKNSKEEENGRENGKPRKKKSKFKRFLAVILVLAIAFAGLWITMVSSVYKRMEFREVPAVASQSMKEAGVVNILLIGNDSRSKGEDGRSDAMILLSVSSKTKSIHMTSLLRDMYVQIPGYKGNRLNAAYSYGGAELLMQTVEDNLEIEINRYILVNFQAFANLVDAVGGIKLELSNEEVQWVNAYLNEYNMLEGKPIDTDYLDTSLSGMIHLNGPQALAYSRNRYIGTDFGRTERQRKILSAVIKKLPLTMVTNPVELINGLFPNLTTNLTQNECLRLSLLVGKLFTYDIIQGSIPVEGSFKNASIRGMDVLEVDFDKNHSYIRSNIYGEQ